MTQVDWGQLQDAYGPADKIPSLIKALTTKRADKCVEELRDRLAHQGWVAPAAVPGIAELLAWLGKGKGAADIRADVVALLADLVSGGEHLRVLQRGEPADALWSEAQASQIVGLLGAEEPEVRTAAGLLCAVALPRDISAPAVEQWFHKEEHKTAKASALLALGFCHVVLPSEKAAGKALAPLLVLASALAKPGELSDDILEQLVEAVKAKSELKGLYWSHDRLWFLAQQLVLEFALGHDATPWLWLLLDASGNPSPIAQRILERTLPPRKDGGLLAADELSHSQQKTLSGLLERKLILPSALRLLLQHGLVDVPEVLRRQLVGPSGPLDAKSEGEPLWRIANQSVHGHVTPAKWLKTLKATCPTTEEQIAALRDCVEGYPIGLIFPPANKREDLSAALALVASSLAELVKRPELLLEAAPSPLPKAKEWRLTILWAMAKQAKAALPAAAEDELKQLLSSVSERQADAAAMLLKELPLDQRVRLIEGLAFRQGYDSVKRRTWVQGGWWFVEVAPTPEVLERAAEALAASPQGKAPVDNFRAAVNVGGAAAKKWLAARLARGDEVSEKLGQRLQQ